MDAANKMYINKIKNITEPIDNPMIAQIFPLFKFSYPEKKSGFSRYNFKSLLAKTKAMIPSVIPMKP